MPKPKSKTSPKAGRDPRAIELRVDPNDQAAKDAAMAQAVLRPSVLAALTIKDRFPDDDNLTVAALTAALAAQNAKIRDGDMARPEAMLIAQAHTLDTLFAELVGRSRANSRGGLYELRRPVHAPGPEGARPVPHDPADPVRYQKPPPLYPKQSGAVSTGQQRHAAASRPARGKTLFVKRTIGGHTP
jgi:hypothetical protein